MDSHSNALGLDHIGGNEIGKDGVLHFELGNYLGSFYTTMWPMATIEVFKLLSAR